MDNPKTHTEHLPTQSTMCDYLTKLHWAVVRARFDNLEYMMTFKQDNPQLKVMSEVIRNQGEDINLIEHGISMFQCGSRTPKPSRQPVVITVTNEKCAHLNELIRVLEANPQYGDLNTKPIKTSLRNIFNVACFN